MPIRILSPTVAAQIAAGEVVERPASVVKELLENALDAGATRIAVEVRGGGLREIRIQDDGQGIPSDEIELAFERHATSKLSSADDLWAIGTLGFRGEALPSIASVAQVVCVSRAAHEEVGSELRIAGGELQGRTPRGCSVGTSMSVRNLFFNTPVRREYLRSEASEASAISAVVQQYALAYPEVRFSLQNEGRLALQTSGNGDLRAVLIEIYGLETARQMLPFTSRHGEAEQAVELRGMLSPPGLTRGSRAYIHLFVNRRALLPRGALVAVLEEAYHTMLMKGRHPLAVIDLRVHPEAVDVNVHPTKGEVKFRFQGKVYSALGRAVREALIDGAGVPAWSADLPPSEAESLQRRFELRRLGASPTPHGAPEPSERAAWEVGRSSWDREHSRWDVGGAPAEPSGDLWAGFDPNQPPPEPAHGSAAIAHFAEAAPVPPEPARPSSLPPLRIVGQVGLTYIVAEAPEGMYLIDQHAAHERITYERLMQQHGRGQIDTQPLLLPQTVNLSPEACALLLGNPEPLAAWGFGLEAWGDEGMVRVRAVPATLPPEDLATALSELADHLAGRGGSTPLDWREAMLTTLSCHTSIRAGQALSLEEMRELLRRLEACQSPRTCPHGRPTMILLAPALIERQFGRRA